MAMSEVAFEAHLAAMAAAGVNLAVGHRVPLAKRSHPDSRHQTIAHARGVVSIARKPRDQGTLLDPSANGEQHGEQGRYCDTPPGSQQQRRADEKPA